MNEAINWVCVSKARVKGLGWVFPNKSQFVKIDMFKFIALISILTTLTSTVAWNIPSKPILIKYGGNAMTKPELSQLFCQDVVELSKEGQFIHR